MALKLIGQIFLCIAKKRIITKVISLVDESESSPIKSSTSNSSLDSPCNNKPKYFEALHSIYLSEKECN